MGKEEKMLKKLLLVGVAGLMMWTMLGEQAQARCRIVAGALRCSDPEAVTFLKGVGNPDVNSLAVCVSMAFTCEGQCLNPADNSASAQGIPFTPQITVCGDNVLQYYMLSDERGSAEVGDIVFSLEEINAKIQAWINEHFSDVCPNNNWTFDWGIKGAHVYYATYQQTNKGLVYSSSELCRRCDVVTTFGASCDGSEDPDCADCGIECSDLDTADECTALGLDVQCLDEVVDNFPGY